MKYIQLNDSLFNYIEKNSDLCHPVLDELAAETRELPDAGMQISKEQGSFLFSLCQFAGVKNSLEIGCYTGYSSICIASGLAPSGQHITIDINPETTKMATKYFHLAGLSDRIELRLGRALDVLPAIAHQYGSAFFDLIFIDADKENLIPYYEATLPLLRKKGLLIVDNALWSGRILDPKDQSPSTQGIRDFTQLMQNDTRVFKHLLPVADGLMILLKI